MNKIKEWLMELKYAKQRINRGYSDRDLWNFESFLSEIIEKGLLQLSNDFVGYPYDLDKKKWEQILKEISFGFGSYLELQTFNYIDDKEETKRLEKEYKKGLKLFVKHFGNLWD